MRKIAFLAAAVSGFAFATAAPAMAMGHHHVFDAAGHSAPAADIGSGLPGGVAAFAGLSAVLAVLVRRRIRR